MPTINAAQVAAHSTKEDLWVVADGYVANITSFVAQHPGGIEKILTLKNRSEGFSFSTHFKHTSEEYATACALYESQGGGVPVTLDFKRSRINGGLDRNGEPTTAGSDGFVGTVVIMGKYVK